MRKILVTGGAGFIGANFIRFVLQNQPEVEIVNLDALTYAGSLENLSDMPDAGRHNFIEGNICDREQVENILRDYQINTIVHFAAETHVDRSIVGPGLFIQTNVVGTFTLLEAARLCWLEQKNASIEDFRFHHISTDEVYGALALQDPPWAEETPYAPNSPYSASKAASDHLVRAYGHTYGLPISITNCSNNYGPYQFPEKFIPLVILNAISGNPLPIYGDGSQIRDWLYVGDHCEAIWLVITKGLPGETYNVGGGVQPTNIILVEHICAILDELLPNSSSTPHKQLISYVQDRPGHDLRYAIDYRKINQDLGWKPRHSLGEGLDKTIRWYLDHQDWLGKISQKKDYHTWIQENYVARRKSV